MSETPFDRVLVGKTCLSCKGTGQATFQYAGQEMSVQVACNVCSGTGVERRWVTLNTFVSAFWKEAVKMGILEK